MNFLTVRGKNSRYLSTSGGDAISHVSYSVTRESMIHDDLFLSKSLVVTKGAQKCFVMLNMQRWPLGRRRRRECFVSYALGWPFKYAGLYVIVHWFHVWKIESNIYWHYKFRNKTAIDRSFPKTSVWPCGQLKFIRLSVCQQAFLLMTSSFQWLHQNIFVSGWFLMLKENNIIPRNIKKRYFFRSL